MSHALKQHTMLEIGADDLCAILTEHFCGGYGAFKELTVAAVAKDEAERTFMLELVWQEPGA